ncbi:MAG: hypothetical protein J6Z34_05545 [Clostridia bacterium]|nr:hypothetical protein [Clostridia bacterium]
MKLKNTFIRILTVIFVSVFLFTAASCEEFYDQMGRGCNAIERELNSAFDKLIVKLQEAINGVNFIIDNFAQLTNPLSENGELVDEWVGTDLEELFVMPECVTEFNTGYREENDRGITYSNVTRVDGAEGVDAFIQTLKTNGYDAYKEDLTWSFYSYMLRLNQSKLCMALEKDGVYIVIAYFATEDEVPNAVFTISNYDTLEKPQPSENDENGEGGENGETPGENGEGGENGETPGENGEGGENDENGEGGENPDEG